MQDNRYKCQIALPGFGAASQQKLSDARVLIVGIGGLGCPAAQYLAAAGVGTIGLVDADRVSETNLHRQILYGPADVGQYKVSVAASRLQQQNPAVSIQEHICWLDANNAIALINNYDLVLDCTDSFATKYLINDAAVIAGKPIVFGAIYQYEGQLAVWNALNPDGSRTPHYRDVFPQANTTLTPACAEGGVIPMLAGTIGCWQANEVIKLITGNGSPLCSKLLIYNALEGNTQVIKTGAKSRTPITELQAEIVPTVSVTEWQNNKKAYYLVDVRTPEEHAAVNLGGINIPLNELSETHFAGINQPILFYCATGKRSLEASRFMQGKLTVQLWSLQGGMEGLNVNR